MMWLSHPRADRARTCYSCGDKIQRGEVYRRIDSTRWGPLSDHLGCAALLYHPDALERDAEGGLPRGWLRAVMRGDEIDLATVGVKGIVKIQHNGATTMTLRAPGVEAAALVGYEELELMRTPSAPPWSLSLWTRGERPVNAEYMDADDLARVLARWVAGSADPIQETP